MNENEPVLIISDQKKFVRQRYTNYDLKSQQTEILRRKKFFFNSTLYHLIKKPGTKDFYSDEHINEIKVGKSPLTISPAPSSISTISSKIVTKNNNTKLPLLQKSYSSRASFNSSVYEPFVNKAITKDHIPKKNNFDDVDFHNNTLKVSFKIDK